MNLQTHIYPCVLITDNITVKRSLTWQDNNYLPWEPEQFQRSDEAALWLRFGWARRPGCCCKSGFYLSKAFQYTVDVFFFLMFEIFISIAPTSVFKGMVLLFSLSRINLPVSHDSDSSLAWCYYASGWRALGKWKKKHRRKPVRQWNLVFTKGFKNSSAYTLASTSWSYFGVY